MNWGVFVSLGTIGGFIGFLLLTILVIGVLFFLLSTPWGLLLLLALVVYAVYRLFRT